MQALRKPIEELAEFQEIQRRLEREKETVSISGCIDAQKSHMIFGLSEGYRCKMIITYNDLKARELYQEYQLYDRNVMLFPAKDVIFYQADIHGNQLVKERIKVLKRVMEGKPVTIVTTFAALMTPQTMWQQEDILFIERGGRLPFEETGIAKKLVELGYEKCHQVENQGQFSLRGGILDIYDVSWENPVRIEFWGDEVESIRSFDCLSQRSIEKLEAVQIYPAREYVLTRERLEEGVRKIEEEGRLRQTYFREQFLTQEAANIKRLVSECKENILEFGQLTNLDSFLPYFYDETYTLPEIIAGSHGSRGSKGVFVAIDEPLHLKEQAQAVELEFTESMKQRVEKGYMLAGQCNVLHNKENVAAHLMKFPMVLLSTIGSGGGLFRPSFQTSVQVKTVPSYNKSFATLVSDLKKYKKEKYRIVLLSGSRTRAKRLAADLRDNEITAVYSDDPYREAIPGEVLTLYGNVSKGFEYPALKFVVISETDIFGAEQKKKKRKRYQYQGQRIRDYTELKVGDYVVHESHGLGIYQGIEKLKVDKVIKDYIKISYSDGGNLYVSVNALDVIQKYADASTDKKPKLNKLGTKEWSKTKAKVKTAVDEIARDLVELYAVRQKSQGHAFEKDTVWQREFEEMFPFQETEDQLEAIADTKADMESHKIMDRLICGDVGYGKTEIAIRAAFKAVQDGKQVAYLVPTTILAQQHYNTFVQRMKDFPVRIDLMSRFRTTKQQKQTVADLKKGMVDIVIGTHRILSSDMEFKDLGLLIIDEEQRFGVAHKEKIKKMKENIDVLTLTATPIPRTLHMSMIGIRDMSILEEAPEDRLPIQTFVCEYNDELVREAIARELARDGQVYYVYNRVNNIADIAAQVAKLVPQAVVEYAHGQMSERELERIMVDFINGEIDVLVSTTIIETGLDISNANTMIIHDSDNMGLSQLYQLRGRVGRSNRNSYAFLMYKRDKVLKEVAEKRLAAIREFTDLGSGFKIAMRDLEIRGAGNLLGMKQHGHMEAVGYDLYCKMLNEAIKRTQGYQEEKDFTTTVDLDVDAYIPGEYIVNEAQKLDIYRRIAGIQTQREKEEMQEELLDRFGSIPRPAENLLRIALIREQAHKLYLSDVRGKRERITLSFLPDAKINGARIPEVLKLYNEDLKFQTMGIPGFVYRYKSTGLAEKDGELMLSKIEELLDTMRILLEDVK